MLAIQPTNSDKNYFAAVVQSAQLLKQSLQSNVSGILNHELEIVVPTQFDSPENLTQNELDHILDHSVIRQTRKLTLNGQRTNKILIIRSLPSSGTLILIAKYTPIINHKSQNIIGIAESLSTPSAFNLASVVQQVYKYGSPGMRQLSKFRELSSLEQQVVFFFMLKLDSEKIARMLSEIEKKYFSKSAVERIITKTLMPKFLACHRNALYDRLFAYGYANFIPREILSHGITTQLNDFAMLN